MNELTEALAKISRVQDTIEFTLSAEDVLVNHTIKVSATVVAMVPEGADETTLRANIAKMMDNFIQGASWQFSNMRRSRDSSGWERITLDAMTRVEETEHRDLEGRADAASQKKDALNITKVHVDTAPSTRMIRDAEKALRISLIKDATKNLDEINEATSGGYRIGSITFHASNAHNVPVGATMAMASSGHSYGSGFSSSDPSSGGLGNAMKLELTATVEFRKHAPLP